MSGSVIPCEKCNSQNWNNANYCDFCGEQMPGGKQVPETEKEYTLKDEPK